ncbi:hypothetical protein CKY04_11185 [Photorhabdus sp. S8-52]|nr:hypothetical protein CKY05_11100 [Photorhabdus sp. S10-54]RAW98801.1 hypothetical protein CKY03_10625 [Photorhabdus sp. S9-53]RAX02993.1 hypothetical protein CKY04_11185 [Photorhabdus sp. S8-52]
MDFWDKFFDGYQLALRLIREERKFFSMMFGCFLDCSDNYRKNQPLGQDFIDNLFYYLFMVFIQ